MPAHHRSSWHQFFGTPFSLMPCPMRSLLFMFQLKILFALSLLLHLSSPTILKDANLTFLST
jgi:hypothetical protein